MLDSIHKGIFGAVIFDLDGTLVDSLHDIADAMNRVLTQHGYPIHSYQAYRSFVGKGLKNLTERVLSPEVSDPTILRDIHHDLLLDYKENAVRKTILYPGIKTMLNALTERKIGMAILSNKTDDITQRVVGELLSNWSFVCVLGTKTNIPRKPDPTGAHYCLKVLGVNPASCLYVGDSGIDMQTAVQTGMMPIGVSWGFRDREELFANGAHRVIDQPETLISIVDGDTLPSESKA